MGTKEKKDIIGRDKSKSKMWASLGTVILCSLVIVIMAFVFGDKNIAMQCNAEDYHNRDYYVVKKELEEMGFSDIQMESIEDLDSSEDMKVGTINSISIGGKTDFAINDEFLAEDIVLITYHSVKTVEVPISDSDIQEYTNGELVELFTKAEFNNIKVNEVYDLDPDEYSEPYVNEVTIDGFKSFITSATYPIDAEVVVTCHYPYEKYTVQIKIDFIPNLLFNKYDVDVLVGEDKLQTIEHGKDADIEFRVKDGPCTVKFVSSESQEVQGVLSYDSDCDIEAEYELYCYGDYIDLKESYIDYKKELAEGEVKITGSTYDFRGRDYMEVSNELKELGFENVIEEPMYDIIFGITEDGSVDEVVIDGKNDYKKGTVLSKDSEVIIRYHMPTDSNPALIAMPMSSFNYKGWDYNEVEESFEKLGFTNIVTKPSETSDMSKTDYDVESVTVEGRSFDKGDTFLPEKEVVIYYYVVEVDEIDSSVTESDIISSTDVVKFIKYDKVINAVEISEFVLEHQGETIELELITAFVENYRDYDTRFNYVLYAVENNEAMLSGPAFMFQDVNYYDLKLAGDNKPDSFDIGMHCHVRAEIDGMEDGFILLDPVEIKVIKAY